jgi:pyridoxine 5-phosphate synthase
MPLKLGVNIDHVATLRQARYRGQDGKGEPDPVEAARRCEAAGAQGITAHLREDRRHIQERDVVELRRCLRTRLNLEMANTSAMVRFALKLKPDIICLVPERRQELTTEGGLDAAGQVPALRKTMKLMKAAGIEVSLFIAPDVEQVEAAAEIGADFVELHTGPYAHAFHRKRERQVELNRLVASARRGHELGVEVNAGHGLNVPNVALLHVVPHLVELNIGHSIMSRAVFIGLEAAVHEMLEAMEGYPG